MLRLIGLENKLLRDDIAVLKENYATKQDADLKVQLDAILQLLKNPQAEVTH